MMMQYDPLAHRVLYFMWGASMFSPSVCGLLFESMEGKKHFDLHTYFKQNALDLYAPCLSARVKA